MTIEGLSETIENSDVAAIKAMKEAVRNHDDPWQIHLSLYPVVQRVLNPPFINPHLPKMYNICRELSPYLTKEGRGALVYLELMEYTRRAKLERPSSWPLVKSKGDFHDIEKSIAGKDREETTMLLSAFLERQGGNALLRRLILLGSGYLKESLGHSVSCTAFILREVIERPGTDARPALFLLADYFCKGGFHTTPALAGGPANLSIADHLLRSLTGSSFVDLHHTITLYAIERMKPFLTAEEHLHLIASWLEFIGEKPARPRSLSPEGRIGEYGQFLEMFSQLDAGLILDHTGRMLASPEDRFRLSSFLITGVCDLYRGNYDPHYLTGLGSLLWVMHSYHDKPVLIWNALHQYLDFYFKSLRAEA